MRFTKMHGIGNDYVYVDCFKQATPANPAALARRIADRHMGVGGDGLILVCPSSVADARMRMFNADGSEAEMCGNGVRCVAKYVYDHGIAQQPELSIETGRGVLTLNLKISSGKVEKVRVDLGEPILEPAKIPALLPGERVVNAPLPHLTFSDTGPSERLFGQFEHKMTCVSVGNPHVIIYCHDTGSIPLEIVGPALETASIFPKRINVHFVEVHSPREVTMRSWERGTGITLACGTGASAVCVAGVLAGKTGRKILAHLPGGDLELEWNESDNHVYMTGPAAEVFSGEWPE